MTSLDFVETMSQYYCTRTRALPPHFDRLLSVVCSLFDLASDQAASGFLPLSTFCGGESIQLFFLLIHGIDPLHTSQHAIMGSQRHRVRYCETQLKQYCYRKARRISPCARALPGG